MEEPRKRDERGVRIAGAYRKRYEGVEEPGQMPDLSALLEVSIKQLESRKMGRIAKYADTQQGLQDFLTATADYFKYIQDANRENEQKLIPDIEGWACFIGVSKQTLCNYTRRNENWRETISFIKDEILSMKKQLAFRCRIPPVVYLNDVSNNHGYLNTSEFRLTTQQTAGEDTLKPAYRPEEIVIRRELLDELREEGRLLPDPAKDFGDDRQQPPELPKFDE